VKQRHPAAGSHQVHGDAVGDGHGQEDARTPGDPAVNSLDVNPALSLGYCFDDGAMNLIPQDDCPELFHVPPQSKPPIHHLAHRLASPEAQIKSPPGLGAPGGDSCDDAVAFAPSRDLEPRHRSREGNLGD
jgi:hypothetical protein